MVGSLSLEPPHGRMVFGSSRRGQRSAAAAGSAAAGVATAAGIQSRTGTRAGREERRTRGQKMRAMLTFRSVRRLNQTPQKDLQRSRSSRSLGQALEGTTKTTHHGNHNNSNKVRNGNSQRSPELPPESAFSAPGRGLKHDQDMDYTSWEHPNANVPSSSGSSVATTGTTPETSPGSNVSGRKKPPPVYPSTDDSGDQERYAARSASSAGGTSTAGSASTSTTTPPVLDPVTLQLSVEQVQEFFPAVDPKFVRNLLKNGRDVDYILQYLASQDKQLYGRAARQLNTRQGTNTVAHGPARSAVARLPSSQRGPTDCRMDTTSGFAASARAAAQVDHGRSWDGQQTVYSTSRTSLSMRNTVSLSAPSESAPSSIILKQDLPPPPRKLDPPSFGLDEANGNSHYNSTNTATTTGTSIHDERIQEILQVFPDAQVSLCRQLLGYKSVRDVLEILAEDSLRGSVPT